jgi:predicted site-specific integrase-resolvase
VSCDGMEPEDLARDLAISGKELRKWLRERFPREVQEHGKRWRLTHAQVQAARRRWGATL